jgi:hypothetical protein
MTEEQEDKPAPSREHAPSIRGATPEVLTRAAGAYLASLRWEGPASHIDTLPAGDFLARL